MSDVVDVHPPTVTEDFALDDFAAHLAANDPAFSHHQGVLLTDATGQLGAST